MTTEDRDARLTAFALNDPGLSVEDRQSIEAELTADPAARKAVDETRKLAELLAAALSAEQATAAADGFVTVPPPIRRRSWRMYAVAAGVLAGLTAVTLAGHSILKPPVYQGRPMSAKLGGAQWQTSDQLTVDADRLGDDGALGARSERQAVPSTPAPIGELAGLQSDTRKSDRAEVKTAAPPVAGPGGPDGRFGGGGYPGGSDEWKGGMPGSGQPLAELPAKPAEPTPPSPAVPGNAGRDKRRSAPSGDSAAFARAVPTGNPHPELKQLSDDYRDATRRGAVAAGEAELLRQRYEQAVRNEIAGGRYRGLIENSFTTVQGQAALSTFGIDVDTASYSIVRKYLSMGQLPPADAVRLEELVNYFPYRDKPPEGNDPFAVTVEMAACPWQPNHRLARIGLKAKPIDLDKRPVSNLVFLIDVSGSMNEPNKLPLVKESLRLLVNQLGENDRVAMVVYAGASGLVLDSTTATDKPRILSALDRLSAGGSTNGGSGIQLAYGVAAAHFIPGGTNRVILCTDGDWNVGTTGTAELVKLIEEKRQTGVFLSVLGFGMGNLRDEMMVQMAGKGNGNYAYIDTIKESHKALVEQLAGTLVTVAKDVKIQVEFNPAVVKSYRLLGYEKRALAAKDFADDRKDAGEMGAGHVVTALYELVPVTAPVAPPGEGLRYQPAPAAKPAPAGDQADEAFVVKLRHKHPDGDTSTPRELPVKDSTLRYDQASEDFRFSAAVASFAMLLRESPYRGNATFAAILELAEAAKSNDPNGYRAEFVELVKRAKGLSGKP